MLNINDKTVAFISDWEERSRAQQKKYVRLSVAAFALTFLLCLLLFFCFQNANYKRIVEQNMNYVQDSAIREADTVEQKMEDIRLLTADFANQYANLTNLDPDMTIEEKLLRLQNTSLFDGIAFFSPDGTETSLEGTTNISDRDYFQRGMNGESGWELIENSRVTGNPVIVFYAPIYDDGEIIGIMGGIYSKDRMSELFSHQLFNYQPDTYLLLGDGTTVTSSKGEDAQKNPLEQLSHKKFIGVTDYAAIEDAIASESRTIITFSFINGHETSVGVIIQFNNSDWMILSILPHNVTANMVGNANRMGMWLLIAVVILFLFLISVLIYLLNRQKDKLEKEMSMASDSLRQNLQLEQQQLSIIKSLGDVYSSIYYINLENLDYQRIKEDSIPAASIPENGKADEGFAAYIANLIDEADQDVMRIFTDTATFPQRLGHDRSLTIEYRRKGAGWCRATMAPAGRSADGLITSALFAVQRIDEQKKRELQTKQALQEAYEAANLANDAKTTFLSNMSHDIRTPMNAIVGMTAIAAANIDNTEKVSDCLKKITSSSKHLLGLINEVLDMSKIESGKIDLYEEEFSLSDLFDNLISIHQPLIKGKNHTLFVKVNNLTHEQVVGDSTRLLQVFSNFLSNAIKYTPENGKIEITLSEKETNKPTVGWYEVTIKDNGIGMSEEFRQKIFEPFTRAKDERISNIQGTGLGMPIAKNIVSMMNGNIIVDSKIDDGTSFTVSFALKLQTEETADYRAFADLPVLVVDDDVTACESTCNILNSLSMDSEWVTSGREAIERTLRRHETDSDYYAVIVDWKMPDMNGIETTREIRRQVGIDIPIIVISAYDWTDIEQEAREAGANAFVGKPLFKSRIVNLFSDLIGSSNKKKDSSNIKDELQKYDFSGKRILLVEDNDINRELAVELLSMVKLVTETAEDGKIGLETFEHSKPGYYDLILMDIQMPVMNGYEAAQAIRASAHPDAKNIPIIAMSADAFASDVQAALQSGMNGHIAKPIDIHHVIRVLDDYIGER